MTHDARAGKRIAVYFTDPSPDGYPLDKEYYRIAYTELTEEIQARGGRLFAVRGVKSFLGKNRFTHGWEFTKDGLIEHPGELEVDIIYDKGSTLVPDGASNLLNDPEMSRICTDKFETFKLFPSHSPATSVAASADGVPAAVDAIPSERIVIKPLDGEEGRGVAVIDRTEALAKIPSYPYLLQEFLDLSDGIPGLVASTHDLRITSISGKIVLCFIRTPPPNSFLANVAQGGTKIEVPLDKIPDGARAIWNDVEAVFKRYPRRVYSVDMGRRKDGVWKIIEINDKPGCTCRSEGPNSAKFMELLAEALVS